MISARLAFSPPAPISPARSAARGPRRRGRQVGGGNLDRAGAAGHVPRRMHAFPSQPVRDDRDDRRGRRDALAGDQRHDRAADRHRLQRLQEPVRLSRQGSRLRAGGGDFPAALEWLPYVLDIPSYLGSAGLDAEGRVARGERNAHQWRRVRYSYMDCRREARRRGLTIRGTRKIWDSTPAAVAMLYRQAAGCDGVPCAITTAVFDRFWKRELDIEDAAVLARRAGRSRRGYRRLRRIPRRRGPPRARRDPCRAAHEAGVFGVPTFVVDGELFWGREHFSSVRDLLRAG